MKLNPSWFVYMSMVVGGVALVWSSTNWFWVWVGFELSLMGFLPMLTLNFFVVEGMVKYFLIQAGGSGLFLASFVWSAPLSGSVCLLGMALKLGVFPFYQWVPGVMKALSWDSCFFLVSLQKVPALLVVCQLQLSISIWLGSLSVLAAGLLGINQTNLRALLGYSSVGHGGWLLLCSVVSPQLLGTYFLVYVVVNGLLFYLLWDMDASLLFHTGSHLTVSTLLLTLAGLPPFVVFFLKVCVLSFIYPFSLSLIWVIIGSLCSIFYYLLFLMPAGVIWSNPSRSTVATVVLHLALGLPMILFLTV